MAALASIGRLARRYSHFNWSLADQAMVSGSNVLTGILLARFLGTDGFGEYTLAWAILLFVAAIHLALVVGSMMSIGPKQSEEDVASYWGAVIVQNLAFAVVGAAVVFTGARVSHLFFPTWDMADSALPLAAATFAVVWQEFFRRYFYTRDRSGLAFGVDALRYAIQIALLLILFLRFPGTLDTQGALWIVAISAAAPALLSPFFLGVVDFHRERVWPVLVRHYESGKWMVISAPFDWASEYVFFFVTGSVLATADVGALRASQNIAAMTSILFLSLLNVVPQRAARHLHTGGRASMDAYLRRVTIMGAALTGGVCLVIAAVPEFWLGLLFGSEFVGYGEIVRWWALVYTVNFFVLPLRSGLRALEATQPVFTARIVASVFAVAVAWFLVSWLGLRGAPIGVLATKVVLVGTMTWLFTRARDREALFQKTI